MHKRFALAALASCLSFGASAQSFFDSFDNQTRLPQWTLSGAFVVDAVGNDDYLALPAPSFGSATFTFNTAQPTTRVSLSMLYAGQGDIFNQAAGTGTVQFSFLNTSQTVSLPVFGITTDNPGPLGRSISFDFIYNIPQNTPVSLRFQGLGVGMNIDNVSITAVPEPGTYALMAAGLGAVGFMARRRRNVVASTASAPV